MRPVSQLAMLAAAAAAAAVAACSVDAVTFTQLVPEEDCEAAGDEDDNGAADCDDPACASASACADPTCTDLMRNGDEADVDCGGSCATCGDGARCGADRDCDSGLCGAAACVRRASCSEILAGGFSAGDGAYSVDLDGAGGAPPFLVKCDMTTEGGGWTRFNWVTGAYPANLDPLEQVLSQCAFSDAICRGRIPASAAPIDLMIKDLGDGDTALWHFDATNVISSGVLGAFRDKITACLPNQGVVWQPYSYSGAETFCGNGGGGGCDSFAYVNTSMGSCSYAGWYTQMDDDTGCYNTAFKMGMTHTGYETIGCASPDVNYLDDGAVDRDDNTGELYYR